jgi:tetratricopeptide (TPR) repeat protein
MKASSYMKRAIGLGVAMLLAGSLYAQDPVDLTKKGIQLSEKKSYDEAIKEFKKAIDIHNASSAKAYHNMGQALELKGELVNAIPYYEEAVKRNPAQVPSYERLGSLYFQTGEFEKAVATGEYVLKIDPDNKEVMQWLPDAYRMKLQRQQEMLLAKQKEEEERKKKALEQKKAEEKQYEEELDKKKAPRLLYATLDFTAQLGYYYEGSKFKLNTDEGTLVDMPEWVYVDFTPNKDWELEFKMGNPYLGAVSPNLVNYTETFQVSYLLDKYYLGAGVMGSHYRDDFAFINSFNAKKTIAENDFKLGLVFGKKEEKSVLKVALYPRFMPQDTRNSKGKTLDTGFYEFTYNYTFDRTLSYYSRVTGYDFYYFDNPNRLANYWGLYELAVGFSFNKYNDVTREKSLIVTIEFIERLYLRNLNNSDPYDLANGQSMFGIDSKNWLKGRPFSGYYSNSHSLLLRVDEMLTRNAFVYQKIGYEMNTGRGDHNEITLLLGAGAVF